MEISKLVETKGYKNSTEFLDFSDTELNSLLSKKLIVLSRFSELV